MFFLCYFNKDFNKLLNRKIFESKSEQKQLQATCFQVDHSIKSDRTSLLQS